MGNDPTKSEARHRRLCVITETFQPEVNGVAHTLARLTEGLKAKGHSVSVIRPTQTQELYTKGYTRKSVNLSIDSEFVVRGGPLPFYKELRFGFPAGRFLKRLWKHERPDAIYIATQGPLGLSAVLAARAMQIPIISGFHTNFHSYMNHYGLRWLESPFVSYLKYFHNLTECTLAPSIDILDSLLNLGIRNVATLARGVDCDLFSPKHRCEELRSKWGASSRHNVAIYVGRLAAEKGIDVVIETYRQMKQQNPSQKLVLVGDGPCRKELAKNNPDVIFMGRKSGLELSKCYASADIFLFASETETFGNVTLEAMASGLGIVAYNYAAAKMHLQHGQSAMLAPLGRKELFKQSALELLFDSEKLSSMRATAHQKAQVSSWSQIVSRFESIIERNISSNEEVSNLSLVQRWLGVLAARATIG